MDNRERETELRLLREVMQWTGLQTGIFDLGKRDAYTEKDFQHLEDFLLSRFPGNEKLKRENIYGYISAKSLHRFWKSEEEKGGDVRKILSVIAISNRNPFVDIPVRRSGEHYKPVVDLWEEYRKIPAAEPEAAPATPEKIGRFKKTSYAHVAGSGVFVLCVFRPVPFTGKSGRLARQQPGGRMGPVFQNARRRPALETSETDLL